MNSHEQLLTYCKSLRLPSMAAALADTLPQTMIRTLKPPLMQSPRRKSFLPCWPRHPNSTKKQW